MAKIKIKNFGPIKEGFKEILPDGTVNEWIDIKKVTVFIGNQGSGKSTVAKVISTMTWMEKALSRGDESKESLLKIDIYRHFKYQRIEKYFRKDSMIEYDGEFAKIVISSNFNECLIDFDEKSQLSVLPKIMYIPSERNFLTVIREAYNVTNIPDTLRTFGAELKKSFLVLNNELLELPIGKEKLKYNKNKDKIYLILEDLDLEISDASSGYQSFVPLFAVTRFLSLELQKGMLFPSTVNLSIDQYLKWQEDKNSIFSDSGTSGQTKRSLVKKLDQKYFTRCLINIVEEPEQNLFPSSQRSVLYSLLEYNNLIKDNKLIMTTHSPYLINYLTLCVKAEMVASNLNDDESKKKLAEIVPLHSTVKAEDLVIYELNEKDGTITKLSEYKGLPSDENYLNNGLEDSNELFAQLQEIEKGWR